MSDDTTQRDFINLVEDRYLPAGLDVDRVISDRDERELVAVWNTYHWLRVLRDMVERAPDSPANWQDKLDQLAPVTACQALAANRRLVELLTGRRWYVMRDAREAGASWADIGAALGISKQSAHEWYQRQIEHQERYAAGFHDTARARAALDGPDIDDGPDDDALPTLLREYIHRKIDTQEGAE